MWPSRSMTGVRIRVIRSWSSRSTLGWAVLRLGQPFQVLRSLPSGCGVGGAGGVCVKTASGATPASWGRIAMGVLSSLACYGVTVDSSSGLGVVLYVETLSHNVEQIQLHYSFTQNRRQARR